jgi:putative ABC transport system ATP-binding protein
MDNHKLTALRKEHFGFIFQTYNLLENLDVTQNVKIGTMLNKSRRKEDLTEIIHLVGLEDKRNSNIYELSGGQQQRVAIARALAKKPEVLFCDEPTGALDEQTSKEILKLMIDLNKQLKTTIILVTHNPIIANIADKIIIMRDGRIESQVSNERKDILNIDWSLA